MNYGIENFLLFLSTNSFPIIITSIFLLIIIAYCSEQKTTRTNFESLEMDAIESNIKSMEKEMQQNFAWDKYLIENGFNNKGKLDILKKMQAEPKDLLRLLEAFLELNPENVPAIKERAFLYDKTSNYEAAKKDCEKYLQYDSTDMNIISLYAETIALLEGEDHAFEVLNKLYTGETKDAEYYSICAEIYSRIKDFDNAFKSVTKSIELAPTEARYYLQRAMVYPANRNTPIEIINKRMEDFDTYSRLRENKS